MLSEILRWRMRPKALRLPLYLIAFVTYRCNSRCRTCFYHQELNRPESSDPPLENWLRLARSLDHLGWLHISGGEPFLRTDLPQLVHAFYSHTGVRRVGIPTNCLLTERIIGQTTQMLSELPGLELNLVLSLDGLPATHDYLRGVKDNYAKTMVTIQKLVELKKRFPGLSLNACTVLNNKNQAEINELMQEVRSMGVDFHDVGLLRGDFPDKELNLPPLERTRQIIGQVELNCKRYYMDHERYGGLKGRLASRIHQRLNRAFLDFLESGKAWLPCLAGDGFAVIEPNGDVRLCELTPVVGNLDQYQWDFRGFWNSAQTRAQRQKAPSCRQGFCTHVNFQTRNLLLNPSKYWKLWT